MRVKKWGYFSDLWNIVDLSFLISFYATMIHDHQSGSDMQETQGEITRLMYVFLIIASFFKLLNLVRVFDQYSFIVKMLTRVFSDIAPFLNIFLAFIVVFASCLHTLNLNLDPALPLEDYNMHTVPESESENPYFGLGLGMYPIYVLRTTLGDFDVDMYKDMPPASRFTSWVLWLIIVCSCQIVFLNFLIAVISDVFAQVSETRTQEVYQKKCELIVEFAELQWNCDNLK